MTIALVVLLALWLTLAPTIAFVDLGRYPFSPPCFRPGVYIHHQNARVVRLRQLAGR